VDKAFIHLHSSPLSRLLSFAIQQSKPFDLHWSIFFELFLQNFVTDQEHLMSLNFNRFPWTAWSAFQAKNKSASAALGGPDAANLLHALG
jgi:hypothetical protein